jgi:hypothetical protein
MTILYVNGDSHTAAAEAVNTYAFAGDDGRLEYLSRLPHPDNLAVSWGKQLSTALKTGFYCEAESAASNSRILRTTRNWLKNNQDRDKLVIIQWSTWEREEWFIGNRYYQVNGSGIDMVPPEYQLQYKEYIALLDWRQKTEQAHQQIWDLHQELLDQSIPHIFFNGNNDFFEINERKDWGTNYIGPYDPACTYDAVIRAAGIETVNSKSYHYGPDGHNVWFRYVLNYIIQHKFI